MDEKRANEIVEESKKRIAKAINLLEATTGSLEFACEQMDWNTDVIYQIKDGISTLGMSLATLVRWDDDDSNSETKEV